MAAIGSTCRMCAASSQSATTRSIPITATWIRGWEVTSRALPSFSTMQTVPVDATPRFTPDTPIPACANFSRRRTRACATSPSRSSGTSSVPASSRKSAATCPRFRCTAGAMMCEGRSPASCRIHSPRSVSTTSMPASVSDSLSLISSVAMDLLLATTVTPRARASPVMYRAASAPSCARTTVPPASRTLACISLRRAGSSRMLRRRMSLARSRMASSP